MDINSGHYIESPVIGGNGGHEFMYQAPPGQWIDTVRVGFGKVIENIEFETNAGEKSARYGGGSSKNRESFSVKGRRISAVKSSYGDMVDHLYFGAV